MDFTFIFTNDPNHGKAKDYRRVFDELNRLNIKITNLVFRTKEAT